MASEALFGGGDVPADVHAFLARSFATVAEVDVLVHLFRRGGWWSADGLGASTGLGGGHARLALDALVAAGVLTCTDGRYGVTESAHNDVAALDAVADRYRRRIIEIVITEAGRRES